MWIHRLLTSSVALVLLASLSAPHARAAALAENGAAEPSTDEVVLLGPLTRDRIEAERPDWIQQQIESAPDPVAAAEMTALLHDAELQIYLGTWCSDSKRELSRFWRALDDVAVPEIAGLSYIGVDRSKTAPAEYVEGVELRFVPTFVVRRHGIELGRVVEEAPSGIEIDLLALLSGTRSGLVTARSDLLSNTPDE